MRSLFNEWKYSEIRQRLVAAVSVLSLAIILTLTAPFEAEAAGFNVNSNVTFTPIPSTYRTTTDTSGCPGFAGKFSFTSLLTNKADSPAMPGITVQVQTLTNGNVLFDPQTNKPLGGEGAVMQVPKTGQYADGLLSPGESVGVPFVLCLKTFQPFQFFVNVSGIVTLLVERGPYSSLGISPNGRFVAFGTGSGGQIHDMVTGTAVTSINFGRDFVFSADSRFVAYWIFNTSGPGHGDGCLFWSTDVFRYDLTTNTRELVSAGRTGAGHIGNCVNGGPNTIQFPRISADGRFVAFVSDAAYDLGPSNYVCARECVWVRDMQTNTTIPVTGGAAEVFGTSISPSISADGRLVAFVSDSTDLTPTPITNHHKNVFVRDLAAGTTTLVSVNLNGTDGGNGDSGDAYFTPDGRVAFDSNASDLVAKDTNGSGDVFVRDLTTRTTTLVSVNKTGDNSGNNGSSITFPVTPNDRYLVFTSNASDLTTSTDTNGQTDVFLRDLKLGATTMASVNRSGNDSGNSSSYRGQVSPDGRFVVFSSDATDLAPNNDTNGTTDMFVRDMQTGTTAMVSINLAGTDSANGFVDSGWLSGNGQFVTFGSNAQDIVSTPVLPGGVYIRPTQ